MLSTFLIAMTMAASQPGVASPSQTAQELSAPPTTVKKAQSCFCPSQIEADLVTMNGLVVGAEVTLAPDRLSTNERQATIFDIASADQSGINGRTKIWHVTSAAKCGVTFDYGKTYRVVARLTETGEYETDRCLMAPRKPRDQ